MKQNAQTKTIEFLKKQKTMLITGLVPIGYWLNRVHIFLTFMENKVTGCCFGPVSVEELISVGDAPSAGFARYGRKISILTCLWF